MDGSKDGWMDGWIERWRMEELINGGIGGLDKKGEMRDGMRNEGWNDLGAEG